MTPGRAKKKKLFIQLDLPLIRRHGGVRRGVIITTQTRPDNKRRFSPPLNILRERARKKEVRDIQNRTPGMGGGSFSRCILVQQQVCRDPAVKSTRGTRADSRGKIFPKGRTDNKNPNELIGPGHMLSCHCTTPSSPAAGGH